MSSLAVTLTVEELEELLARAVKRAIRELDEPPAQPQPTEADLAAARKSLRRFGRGA